MENKKIARWNVKRPRKQMKYIYIKKKILITQPEVTELAPISSVAHVNVVVEGAVENRKVASLKQIN